MKNKQPIKCQECGKILNPKNGIKWLELSITDGNYYTTFPQSHESQGCFPFGTSCATKKINETLSSYK